MKEHKKRTASMREHRSGSVQGISAENDCIYYYTLIGGKCKGSQQKREGESV